MPAHALTSMNQTPATPALIVGAILAMGVIRLMERAAHLDKPPEESGTDGVSTTEEDARE
jgi:hypothetical protein